MCEECVKKKLKPSFLWWWRVRIHPSVAKQQHANQSDHPTGECQESVRNLHPVLHWGKVFWETECILWTRPDSEECDQICGITFDPVTMRTDKKSIFIFKISSQSSYTGVWIFPQCLSSHLAAKLTVDSCRSDSGRAQRMLSCRPISNQSVRS